MLLRELFEAADSVGLIFGRFNPPHKGHKAAWEMASKNSAWYVGTNQSTQGPKDPLPYDIKIKTMKTIWPEVAGHIVPHQSWLTLASDIYKKHGDVELKVYTDEEWVLKALDQYNGVEGKSHGYYNFPKITPVPTPRLSSATALRAAVAAGDRKAFADAAGVPANTPVDGKPFFDLVAEYLGQYKKEDATPDEEDKFHRELDKLVHKTFGHSSDEKKIQKKRQNKTKFIEPNFNSEWEEAERYPEFVKIGKEAWIELAKKGKAVTITSAKGINNTDAADPNSFKSLDPVKQGRALDQLKSGTVEMPIVAVYSDGWKELIGGNTRLTAMLAKNGSATVWAFRVPDAVAELAENFADGKNPRRKGLAKRSGVNTKASVSSLRKTAKNSSGEKQRMAHWLANMKAGRQKAKKN